MGLELGPALPSPALPCPALPCPALPCPALPLSVTANVHVYFALQVRSRTGQELQDGISSLQARDREAELFRTHPELKHVAQEYKGVPALSRKLVQIQAERIQSHLPALQKEVIVHKGTTCFTANMLMGSLTQALSSLCD